MVVVVVVRLLVMDPREMEMVLKSRPAKTRPGPEERKQEELVLLVSGRI